MTDTWIEYWNTRYREKEYAFGKEPNLFLKKQLLGAKTGKILFPAEGEGRNAVFAALLGWEVHAFDISEEGRKKALHLAADYGVHINYSVGELTELDYPENYFDVIGLIYAHFPPEIRSKYHAMLSSYLKQDGSIILEAFGHNHLIYREKNPSIGGPKELDWLFSEEQIKQEFSGFDIHLLEEKELELNEGLYHVGKGSVLRFTGTKKSVWMLTSKKKRWSFSYG